MLNAVNIRQQEGERESVNWEILTVLASDSPLVWTWHDFVYDYDEPNRGVSILLL